MEDTPRRCPKCGGYMAFRVVVSGGRNKDFTRVLKCLKCGHKAKADQEDR